MQGRDLVELLRFTIVGANTRIESDSILFAQDVECLGPGMYDAARERVTAGLDSLINGEIYGSTSHREAREFLLYFSFKSHSIVKSNVATYWRN